MGMGNYSCHADTVEEDFIKEMCGKEFKAFLEVISESEIDIETFAHAQCLDDIDELTMTNSEESVEKIVKVFDELTNAFLLATDGLELNMGYHDPEDVDRGNEVSGAFWTVDGVYVLSKAGEKYGNKIERKFWTEFG